MSFADLSDVKERVRQASDIVDVVSQYLSLQRQGRLFKATCPWHDDSRPSLQVNPERQSFKCWVCDYGGDIFTFVMRIEGVEFREALEILADRAGILLPSPGAPQRGAAGEEVLSQKQRLFEVMRWAEVQFVECLLNAPEAEAARRYLTERGISAESLRQFNLGFAPDGWSWLLDRARQQGHAPQLLEKAGLIASRKSGEGWYDRFRNRVMFSIRDPQKRPVALGGRVLPGAGADEAKYINSPETPLFSKSRMLYGLDQARDSISRQREAIVVEGYTDCIALHQFGFTNSVAVLGTALGAEHVDLLRRFADRIYLVLDGDEAGRKRTSEVLELFVAKEVDLRILTLPENADPCDFLQQRGADALREQISTAVDALEHRFLTAVAGIDDRSGTHQTHQALEQVLQTLARAPSQLGSSSSARLREDQILHRLARQCGVSEERLRDRLFDLRRSGGQPKMNLAVQPAESPVSYSYSQLDPWERELLEILLHGPELLVEVRQAVGPDHLADPGCKEIFIRLCDLSDEGEQVTFTRLLACFDDPQMQSLLVALDERGREKGVADAAALQSLLNRFQERDLKKLHQDRTNALRERRVDENEELKILEQIFAQERSRRQISSPTDG